jgi:subtilisin family serine protease
LNNNLKTYIMKRIVFFSLYCLYISGSVIAQIPGRTAKGPIPIPGQYIITLKESVARPVKSLGKISSDRDQKFAMNNEARMSNLNIVKQIETKYKLTESQILAEYTEVLVGFAAKLTDVQKKGLEGDPAVDEVAQDYETELDPIRNEANPPDVGFNDTKEKIESGLVTSGPNTTNTSADGGDKLPVQYVGCNITKAGGFTDGSGKPTCIWILDTGIDTDHPDLNVVTKYAKSCITLQSYEDKHGHGTHCAGIAAAKNNSFGVVGVSAGAKVVPVKILNNNGKGSWSNLMSGLDHVAKYDIRGDVINLSMGDYGYSDCENSKRKLRDAIRLLGYWGTFVVMASGNDNGNAALNRPGCINGNRVYTVGSINCNTACASYSNFNISSNDPVDWVAVGSSVYSTYLNGVYTTKSGTSMATPAVSGIVHARGSVPANGGTVSCKSKTYKIAKR